MTKNNLHKARRAHDEAGFSLVELLIALSISVLIIGPISAAVIIGLTTTDSSSRRLSQTRDIELVQGVLPRDVLSARSVTPNADASATSACSGQASLLKLTWSAATLNTIANQPPTTSLQPTEVDYYLQATVPATVPATSSLVRRMCGAANLTQVVATALHTNNALQTATISGGTVTLSLTDSSCARFAASAQQRSSAAAAPTSTTATTLPACT